MTKPEEIFSIFSNAPSIGRAPEVLPIDLEKSPFSHFTNISAETLGRELNDSFTLFRDCRAQDKTQKIFLKIMDCLGISSIDPLRKAGRTIAAKLDRGIFAGSGNFYHNRQHMVEVTLCAFHLAQLNNFINQEQTFSNQEIALLSLAALVHDLGHDGKSNGGEMFRLEQRSFNLAREDFDWAGISSQDQELIEIMVLGTDVSGPIKVIENINRYHQGLSKEKPEIPKGMEKFKRFLDDKKATELALLLADADILPSAGLTWEKTKNQTRNIYKEQEAKEPGIEPEIPQGAAKAAFLWFTQNILDGGFRSSAGKFYNDNYHKIIETTHRK